MLLDLRPSNVRFGYDPARGFNRPMIGAVRSVVPVAVGLLWGNVASGLAGALRGGLTRMG
jgi:hypothetical protein